MSSDSTPRTAAVPEYLHAYTCAYCTGNGAGARPEFVSRETFAMHMKNLHHGLPYEFPRAASPAASGDAAFDHEPTGTVCGICANRPAASGDALREALVNLRAAAVAFRGKRAYMDGDPTEQQLTDALIASGHALAASPPLPEGLDVELTTEKRVRQQIVARLRREYPGAIAQIEAAVVDTELLEAVEDVLTSDSLDPDDHLHWSHLRRIVQDRRARLASREGAE